MTYIERILAEIDRQILKLNGEEPSDFTDGAINQTKYFKRFISNLPKEPASEELEEEINAFFAGWSEEDEYGSAVKPDYYSAGLEDIKDVVRHFAQWQKEQMMKDAIEGEVVDKGDFIKFADGKYIDLNPTLGAEPLVKLEEGDKIKVIIIKE